MDTSTINFNTEESTANNSMATPTLDFLTAQNLAASGDLDEAERLLCKNEELPTSTAALDLLARISVQKGQFELAEKLWKTVLEKDPTHEAAKVAIKRLGSPWIGIAIIKRVAVLASLAVLFCLSIVGFFALFNIDRNSQLVPSTPGLRSQDNFRPPVTSDKINTPIKPANRISQYKATSSVFSIPGCSVYANRNQTRIVFEDGLFTFRCKLKKFAKERLSVFARQLRENAPNSRIIIEGHTDSRSMLKNSLYRDNYELGLQRALTIAYILKTHHQIAGGRILISSMGDTNPPFPGMDYESKAKNRTVVFRLF